MSRITRDTPLNVVIVGGSLAGLMHGIIAKRLGHNVHILEQHTSSIREGEAAGVSTGAQTQQFLEKHDLLSEPYYVSASAMHIIDNEFRVEEVRPIPFKLTTWTTLHYRLRANFDGFTSDYLPCPPELPETDGKGKYDIGKRVMDITDSNGKIMVKFEDLINGGGDTLQADFVIAADGSRSNIRRLLYPQTTLPYAGYLTWRATIPESYVSQDTQQAFSDKCLSYRLDKSYIIVYVVPGRNGSLKPGERHINFVWYYNCPGDSEEFAEIMTDIEGHRHRSTLPPGRIQPKVWIRQQEYSRNLLAAPIKEVVEKIKNPFVTAISDFQAPQACFFDNKLILVGDALALFRPHIAQSTNQSAMNALLFEKVLTGDMELSQWETQVMQYAHITRLRSNVVGTKQLAGYWVWLYYEIRFRLAATALRWGFIL